MTTNLECAMAVLAQHREARNWTDAAVAVDLLAQLGLDPAGETGAAPTVAAAAPAAAPAVPAAATVAPTVAAAAAVPTPEQGTEALEQHAAEARRQAAASAQVGRRAPARKEGA